MITLIVLTIVVVRTSFWALTALKTHGLYKEAPTERVRHLVGMQRMMSLAFILEGAFWLLIVMPRPLYAAVLGSPIPRAFVLAAFATQVIPAYLVWRWWRVSGVDTWGRYETVQSVFSVFLISGIAIGVFVAVAVALVPPTPAFTYDYIEAEYSCIDNKLTVEVAGSYDAYLGRDTLYPRIYDNEGFLIAEGSPTTLLVRGTTGTFVTTYDVDIDQFELPDGEYIYAHFVESRVLGDNQSPAYTTFTDIKTTALDFDC